MLNTQPYEFNDFSGGFTDNVLDGSPTQCERNDNLVIGSDKKISTRPGSEAVSDPRLPEDATLPLARRHERVGTLINYDSDVALIARSARRFYELKAAPTGWSQIVGPSGNAVLNTGDADNVLSVAQWQKHLIVTSDAYSKPVKLFRDKDGLIQVRNAGLPKIASNPTISILTPGTSVSHRYVFVYSHEYTVGGPSAYLTYKDSGPTYLSATQILVDPPAGLISATNPVTITSLSWSAVTGDNWDTSKVVIEIYRTTAAGRIFFKVGQVSNPATTFIDTMTDDVLQNQEQLYTTGGSLDNDPPPLARYCHASGPYTLYANVLEGTELLGNRIRQSIAGDPDSCPETFYLDLDEEVTGLSSFNDSFVAFTRRGTYRINGAFDEIGGGGLLAQRIDDTVGCLANSSIVQTPEGLFFFGEDGVYWTNAVEVRKISDHFNETYKTWINPDDKVKYIQGTYDRKERLVLWAFQKEENNGDADTLLVLHLRFPLGEGAFSTWSGGSNFSASALCLYQGRLIRGDKRGYVFRHTPQVYTDPLVDTEEDPADWRTAAIIPDYISVATNFGTNYVKKWVPSILMQAKNITNLSIQIESINDDGRRTQQLAPIRFRGNLVWGAADAVWGDPNVLWDFSGVIEEKRRFPSGGLRCSYKQVRITTADVVITSSDLIGSALVSGSSAMLLSNTWPTDVLDYVIAFESDGYVRELPIITRSDDTLILDDGGSPPTAGTWKWVIKGKPKGEQLSLIGYTISAAMLTQSHNTFTKGESGVNA